jgi:glyoxylase-like metal-dependent hydrolase (beta-lactamase superfamily II)
MQKLTFLSAICLMATFLSSTSQGQYSEGTLEAAARALGSTDLQSIQYSGTGANFAFGQAYRAGDPWPRFNLKSYVVTVDYKTPAMRVEFERTLPPQAPPPGLASNPYIWKGGGGAPPFILPQRVDLMPVHMVQAVSGKLAWNVLGTSIVPAFGPVNARLLDIWTTPHGVIQAAQAAGGKALIKAQRGGGHAITFPAADVMVTATLNTANLVEKVVVPEDNPVLGDTAIETTYSDYREFNGVRFPTHMVRIEGGFPTLELTVNEVRPNLSVNLEVPQNIAQAAAQPRPELKVEAKKLADGVYRMEGPGVSHHSVAVEFKDYIVVIEGPDSDRLALPIIEATKKAIPNKPIKYVVNTHVNFDHAGGLRAFVAEGATVTTHTSNKAYYERVWARPRTLDPDRLAQSPRKPVIESVEEKRVISDGTQQLELYHLTAIWHNVGMLAGYLRKQKILVVADLFEGIPREPAPPNPDFENLFDNIQRLKLDVVQISPLHTPLTTFDELRRAIGNPASLSRHRPVISGSD